MDESIKHKEVRYGMDEGSVGAAQFMAVDSDLPKCFLIAFREDLQGIDVNTFQLWLERTRRSSFCLFPLAALHRIFLFP